MLHHEIQPPWHAGEVALQNHVGVAERMAEIGKKIIRTELIEQHRDFYPLLPMAVLGSVDEAGDVWATVRAGHPGFMSAPDAHALHIDLPRDPSDPADAGMQDGAALALLGIDLRTRRRNRLNGNISRANDESFLLNVEQSFGNCPKYIQLRTMELLDDPKRPYAGIAESFTGLDSEATRLITEADTFFVASYIDRPDGLRQVDVSHRGGRAGFAGVTKDGSLIIPEFTGNRFYNTLGNFLVNPRAGIVFIENGQLLQMTGTVEILANVPKQDFEGAEMFWKFSPRKIVRRLERFPLDLQIADNGWSPNSLSTGVWKAAS
ncbi:pyridoxamine 5'-phosphate oxidase family protein [Phyllobacterium sp. YR531]|uniref:pyridoxamine 5'-phosphate oxidase family protein n=1 Tax=Phyllobacterium sp. YR531 TaxID=1144343 RepID=UPI00026F5245|nr:pyridoxamine 5'-phosphate oxidase family protein [Phyllobacterium sp. YR531]EJN04963.1 pyridoxamine 5'-phosphate oxidase-related, FMN binding protein [Phyllobacterium sp. YR531]